MKIKILQNKYVKLALYIYTVLFPLIAFIALENLNPASHAGLLSEWPPSRRAFALGVVLLVTLAFAVYTIVGSVFWSYTIVSGLILILLIINYFRMQVTGGVLVPSDIFLAGAAAGFAGSVSLRPSLGLFLGIFILGLIHVPLYFVEKLPDIEKIKPPFKWRIIALPFIVAGFIFFLTGSFAINHVLPAAHLSEGTVTSRYRDRGFILGFYAELVSNRQIPAITNETTIFDPIEPQSTEPQTPNVIVILSEAFMDPNVFSNITFSQNPVPNFHRLSESGISGNVLVPVFGGGTVNTELEFLLGTPHLFFGSRFYVPAEMPDWYFSREIPTAMPWLFRENGYRTVGVHPFYSTFFNRNLIYPLIGFDEFIAKEDMPNATVKGEFISDEYFTDRIIEQLLQAEAEDTPLFLFGLSMQNHWGFDPMKYGTLELDVMADSPYLSEEELQRINSYLQGIYDADKQLGRLADFLETHSTPTIVVFFGDHLPILGLHSDRVFETLGFVNYQEDFNWELSDHINIFHTQYLVWANYETGLEEWGNISTSFLGARLVELAGIRSNRYFTYLLRGANYFNGITNEIYINSAGEFDYGWANRENPHVRDMEALWYANILGWDNFHYSLRELVD